MKTMWSLNYLWKCKDQETANWAARKKRELERRTGVGWDWFTTSDKLYFVAYADGDTPVVVTPQLVVRVVDAIKQLTPTHNEYTTFQQIVEETGLDYPTVLGICRFLVITSQAVPSTNTRGQFSYIRMRNK